MYFKHRELDELVASHSQLGRGSFFKILALGLFDIIFTLPIGIFDVVVDVFDADLPTFWPGWKVTHSDFSSIPTITSDEWKSAGFASVSSIRFAQWINPAFAIVFFVLFGLTEKNRLWYQGIFWKALKPFGCRPCQEPVTSDIIFRSVPVPPGSNTTVATSVPSHLHLPICLLTFL